MFSVKVKETHRIKKDTVCKNCVFPYIEREKAEFFLYKYISIYIHVCVYTQKERENVVKY